MTKDIAVLWGIEETVTVKTEELQRHRSKFWGAMYRYINCNDFIGAHMSKLKVLFKYVPHMFHTSELLMVHCEVKMMLEGKCS